MAYFSFMSYWLSIFNRDVVYRTVVLQIDDITKKKAEMLRELSAKATYEFNRLLKERKKGLSYDNLAHESKKRTGFNSDIINHFVRSSRNGLYKRRTRVKGFILYFHTNRDCKIFSTKTFNFLEIRPYTQSKSHSGTKIAIPIKNDSNWQEYKKLLENGWTCNTYGLTPDMQIVAYLQKKYENAPTRPNVLGVDINTKNFAITVLSSDGKVLHQDYFGKDIWIKRRHFAERRAKLKEYADNGSEYAKKALKKLDKKEYNFLKTRIGEVVKTITDMALNYNADIATEKLKLNPKDKRFESKTLRIMGSTYISFTKILKMKCFEKNIRLDFVDPWHTSRFCSHCGAVGSSHDSKNYALFKCRSCGFVVNSDRNASKNIALKSLLERDIFKVKIFQDSNRRVSVDGLMRPNEFEIV